MAFRVRAIRSSSHEEGNYGRSEEGHDYSGREARGCEEDRGGSRADREEDDHREEDHHGEDRRQEDDGGRGQDDRRYAAGHRGHAYPGRAKFFAHGDPVTTGYPIAVWRGAGMTDAW